MSISRELNDLIGKEAYTVRRVKPPSTRAYLAQKVEHIKKTNPKTAKKIIASLILKKSGFTTPEIADLLNQSKISVTRHLINAYKNI